MLKFLDFIIYMVTMKLYGDYEMPLNLFIDSNNMVIGVNSDLDRFYVGKIGEKCKRDGEEVIPINLYFADLHEGVDYLGNDACHQKGLQNYYGYVFFKSNGNKAYLFGAYGDNYQEPCYHIVMVPCLVKLKS